MSFSPYSTMITVCVCFNSRVQLTVPSFTAWLGSRFSKGLFIALGRPAQEKDKGVCQRCHRVKKWAGWATFLGGLCPQPLGPASPGHLLQRPAASTPRLPEGGSSGYQKLHRSWYQMDHSINCVSPTVRLCVFRVSTSLSGKWEP